MSEVDLVKAFPWLAIHNPDDFDAAAYFSESWTTQIPQGWYNAFGMKLITEMDELISSWDEEKRRSFRILDIKEKFGVLRIYTNSTDKQLNELIDKYSKLSGSTCIVCGKKAEGRSAYYYTPLCSKCAKGYSSSEYIPLK